MSQVTQPMWRGAVPWQVQNMLGHSSTSFSSWKHGTGCASPLYLGMARRIGVQFPLQQAWWDISSLCSPCYKLHCGGTATKVVICWHCSINVNSVKRIEQKLKICSAAGQEKSRSGRPAGLLQSHSDPWSPLRLPQPFLCILGHLCSPLLNWG